METLRAKIHDLYYTSIQIHDIKEIDAMTMRTLKLDLVALMLREYGLDWPYILNLYKTHTLVHEEVAREMMVEEEITNALAQRFVRNEKLIRMLKTLAQHNVNMNRLLAVDGLAGNLSNGPNFDQKHYIGNLRFGSTPNAVFYRDPEYKRLHVETVRKMYAMLEKVPVPEKQVYEILRYSFMEMVGVTLPETEFMEEEVMDKDLQKECGAMYMKVMGKENIEQLVKSLRFRGEKRTQGDDK